MQQLAITSTVNKLYGIVPAAQHQFRSGGAHTQQLMYAEYGDNRSDNVVYYQHGWPGSRIGGSMLHEAATQLGLRIIAVDRPGFGGTPFTPHHSLAFWADAVQRLSDNLGIHRFGILGASGGAPFAAACARFIPSDRITGLGLVCPLGPLNNNTTAGMAALNSLLLGIARHCPALARTIWRSTRRLMQWDEGCMQRFALNPQDKAAMQSAPLVAQAIRAAVLEGLTAGAWGVVHEMRLAQRCWGFRLEDIKVKHAFMWHGLQDPLVTLPMAQAYTSIPGCKAVFFPGETHTTLVINKLGAALEALVQQHTPTAGQADQAESAACSVPAMQLGSRILLAQQQAPASVQAVNTTAAAAPVSATLTAENAADIALQPLVQGQQQVLPTCMQAGTAASTAAKASRPCLLRSLGSSGGLLSS